MGQRHNMEAEESELDSIEEGEEIRDEVSEDAHEEDRGSSEEDASEESEADDYSPLVEEGIILNDKKPIKEQKFESDDKVKEFLLPPHIIQIICWKSGFYCSSYLGNDLYYLIEAIKTMEGYIKETKGEEWLRKNVKNWDKKQQNLRYLSHKIQEVKVWYDALEDKKFEKKLADKSIRKFFFKSASKIPLLDQELYELFGFFIFHTNLKRSTIPSEAFKILEHTGRRTLYYGKKKGADQQQQGEEKKQ